MASEAAVRYNSVEIPATRISNTIFMVEGTQEAQVELSFRDNYSIESGQSGYSLVYTVDGELKQKIIGERASHPIETEAPYRAYEGESSIFCISKSRSGTILVEPGECSGY